LGMVKAANAWKRDGVGLERNRPRLL
jgi:hypothetical protein